MHYLSLIITILFFNLNCQENNKLKGRYYCLIENNYYYSQTDKITFNDSTFVFDNKFKPKGKISYGSIILMDNFMNSDLSISIFKEQIKKDTIVFYIHNKKGPVTNYLDISVGKGKFIKIK